MKQFKWLPVSQMVQKKKPEKKRLFNGGGGEGDDNSRASLGMDEDSNMSNLSTASDSLDGPPSLSNIGDRWGGGGYWSTHCQHNIKLAKFH